jgi:hypothetical protein
VRRAVFSACVLAACGSSSHPATVSLEAPAPLPSPPPATGSLGQPDADALEGTWALDAEATFARGRAKLQGALGDAGADVVQMAVTMLREMNMTLDLRPGGAATFGMATGADGDAGPRTNARDARWHREGAEIVVVLDREELRCTEAKRELVCSAPAKPNEITLVYRRATRR